MAQGRWSGSLSARMPICETVSTLAKQLEEQLPALTPNQHKMLTVLKEMPSYKERNDLSSWSSHYKNSRSKEEKLQPNFESIELVYEIGRYNLSTVFDEQGTFRRYMIALVALGERKISVHRDLDVSQW